MNEGGSHPVETGESGRLAENVLLFCRTLRRAGLPLGPGQVIDALAAASMTGLERSDDLYWALRAVLVKDRAQRRLFHQAFHLYFRNPYVLGRIRELLFPDTAAVAEDLKTEPHWRRLLEAMSLPVAAEERDRQPGADRSLTWSRREILQKKDFEQMTLAELAETEEMLKTAIVPLPDASTRRFEPSGYGHRYDLRRSLRLMMQNNGQLIELAKQRRSKRPPALVLICDVSGSMSRYSRVFLQFAHVLRAQHRVLHAFVFATRLTNISRRLADRDCDLALAEVAAAVPDWDGGTRIADCIERFNVEWSRRVLGGDAVVILLSDGLERDSEANLEFQMRRLKRSCRELIWLNPMLRYRGFEPKAGGIRAMLPQVDLFLPSHNVESLKALCEVLRRVPRTRLRMAS